MHYIYCTTKYAQMQYRRASILADTSPTRSTWLASAQFHNRLIPDPHTRLSPAQPLPLLEDQTRIGVGPSEQGGECLKHGALACSHGTFLHVAQQALELPAPLHYISRDHPNAHELPMTNHIRHPSPKPRGVAGRPGKVVAQAVWNCSRVAYWYNRQFTMDTFKWYDV